MQKKLGDILIDSGVLSLDKLQDALDVQKKTGQRLGDIMIEQKLVMEDDVQSAMAQQLGIQKIDLYEEGVDPEVARLLTPDMIQRHQALPITIEGNDVIVAMVDPGNLLAIDDIRLSTGYEVKPKICTQHALKFAFDKFFGVSHEAEKALKEYKEERMSQGLAIDSSLVDKSTLAEVEQAPIVKLVETILNGAFDYKASDIHLEPKEDRMDVRYRVDGMLHKILTIPPHAVSAVTARLKILARLDTSERRKPQDGRISVDLRGHEIDIRFSTLPTINGEKIVMRLLDKKTSGKKLTDLGFNEDEMVIWEDLISRPHGVILITGPTGSGKSSTLIACLGKLATESVNVMTIEDPVEYQLSTINQVHVNNKVGLTFATGLRTFMRQDPDIIMVGEIRDPETSDLAIQAALTGHLVFSTLHTNDAPGAIPRMQNLGVPAYLIDAAVIGIMAQRLVRLLCPHCKQAYEPDEQEIEIIEKSGQQFKQDKYLLYKPKGCKFCNHIGYLGRSGVFEIFTMNNAIRELIKKTTSIHEIKRVARANGMRTLWESGLNKVLKGLTSMRELISKARPDYEEDVETDTSTSATGVRAGLREAAPTLAEAVDYEAM